MKITLIFISLTICLSCKTINQTLVVEQVNTNQNVILRKLRDSKKELSINIPIKLKITNNFKKEKCFYGIEYLYTKEQKGIVLIYIENKNNLLKNVLSSKKKCIGTYQNKEYMIYTLRHYVDTTRIIKYGLKSYMKKLQKLDQDTLSLGSMTEFKGKYNNLIEDLLRKDSIQINFINGYGRDIETEVLAKNGKETRKIEGQTIDYEFIKIPVKW